MNSKKSNTNILIDFLCIGGPIYSSPNVMPISMPSNVCKKQSSLPSSVTTYPLTRKRAASNVAAEVPPSSKKSRAKLPLKRMPNTGKFLYLCFTHMVCFNMHLLSCFSPNFCVGTYNSVATQPKIATNTTEIAHPSVILNNSVAQGSSVAKSLFDQLPNNTTGPTTPPQAISSLNDQTITPVGSNTIQETPTNCTLITSERVIVSPCKHVSYTMERNQCISSSSPVKTTFKRFSKRENVKGRLDFDGTHLTNSFDTPILDEISTSESDKEADIFDIDFVNFEAFGASFSELLVDLDLGLEGLDCPCQPISEMPLDNSPRYFLFVHIFKYPSLFCFPFLPDIIWFAT